MCILPCRALVSARSIVHNGILFSEEDINRAKAGIAHKIYPYYDTYVALSSSGFAKVTYKPNPVAVLVRGATDSTPNENYGNLFMDAAAAYQLALMWTVTEESKYGDAAVNVLTSWANTLETITGTSDKYLASGLYGYQLAVAAEMLREFPGFTDQNKTVVADMLLNKFYSMNKLFLSDHNGHGAKDTHYWANWDLCNVASALAIGVFSDRSDIYEFALKYLHSGGGEGAFHHLFPHVFSPRESNNTFGLAEGQESGRDQGHAGLDFALLAVINQIAYLQGDDLWSYHDHIVLKGAEYFARYNLGHSVPFVPYEAQGYIISNISSSSIGNYRPVWSIYYSTYVNQRNFTAQYVSEFYKTNEVEQGGGSYGPNSGGYDQLGYGSIAYLTNKEVNAYL